MDLMQSIAVSRSGMAAQSQRMKVVSENIANADSLVTESGGPYRRKMMIFESVLDKNTGLAHVHVKQVKPDMDSPLRYSYEPNHPLANDRGYLARPNVNTLAESTDMQDAVRMYEANMAAIESAKEMMVQSLDLLR